MQVLLSLASPLMPEAGSFKRTCDNILELSGLPYDGKIESKSKAISAFERHIEEVKAAVPAEKLLVYEVKEGWEPLCEFLGVEVPPNSFPHLNSSSDFEEVTDPHRRRFLLRVGVASAALMLPVAAVLIGVLWWGQRRPRHELCHLWQYRRRRRNQTLAGPEVALTAPKAR